MRGLVAGNFPERNASTSGPYAYNDIAFAAMASAVIPNCLYRIGAGAEAPKSSCPMEAPAYLAQPNVVPASMETVFARMAAGKTDSW